MRAALTLLARRGLAGLVIVGLAATPVTADVAIDLRAADPLAGLPAIAKNKLNFLRAFRTWRPGCKKPDIYVESGAIEASVDEPQYTTIPLVGGCGEAPDEHAGNVSAINASLSKTQCSTAAVRGDLVAKLPAAFEAGGFRVEVTANASSAHVTINKLAKPGTWTGGRRMQTAITPQEVRGWYLVESRGQRQLAVLLSGAGPDGTISERWMEVWAKKAQQPTAPIDVARTWLLAAAARDATVLAKTTGLPFERIGFSPAEPSAGACKTARSARTAEDLVGVLDCVLAAAPARYASLFDEAGFSKITAKQIPPELEPHAAVLAGFAKTGHTLVWFTNDDERGETNVVFAIKGSKVAAALESMTSK
ncbi:MAG: hypothetical protein JNL83_00460 [Myxococcales bacterium]|nr:hypothetical protein [Myxococcales bacterium]